VVSNQEIIKDHKVITCVAPEIASVAQPGHFVNVLTGDGFDPFLRKPFSIYTVDRKRGEISILYSIVGAVTRGMSKKRVGDEIDIVGPLGGKLFAPSTEKDVTHIMVGGGYGVPPLVFMSSEMRKVDPNVKIVFLIGARHKDLLLCEAELIAGGVDARVTTEDGSRGTHGRVTDALRPILENKAAGPYSVYCCGPTPMMQAVGALAGEYDVPCQVSVEVAMPCGMGVCMACVIDLKDGRRVRCCTEGPVFDSENVIW
jgi:dihydroorotate dehydrogenase electron transfer subunit